MALNIAVFAPMASPRIAIATSEVRGDRRRRERRILQVVPCGFEHDQASPLQSAVPRTAGAGLSPDFRPDPAESHRIWPDADGRIPYPATSGDFSAAADLRGKARPVPYGRRWPAPKLDRTLTVAGLAMRSLPSFATASGWRSPSAPIPAAGSASSAAVRRDRPRWIGSQAGSNGRANTRRRSTRSSAPSARIIGRSPAARSAPRPKGRRSELQHDALDRRRGRARQARRGARATNRSSAEKAHHAQALAGGDRAADEGPQRLDARRARHPQAVHVRAAFSTPSRS